MNPLDLIFTPRCIFCERILYAGVKEKVCPHCHPEKFFITGTGCPVCGRPISGHGRLCPACRFHGTQISGRSLYQYEGVVRQAIHRFKYENMRRYGSYFAERLWEECGNYIRDLQPDALVPVPLHPKRRRQRGYNQAEVLAAELARCSGIPMQPLLERVRYTAPQMSLGYSQRAENIRNAFRVVPGGAVPGRILLLDDIYTTGSTIETCAKALQEVNSGVKVNFLTVAAKIYKEST